MGEGEVAGTQLHSKPPRGVLASAGFNQLLGCKPEPPPGPPTRPRQEHLRARTCRRSPGGRGQSSALAWPPTIDLPSMFWSLACPETHPSFPSHHWVPQGDPAPSGTLVPLGPLLLGHLLFLLILRQRDLEGKGSWRWGTGVFPVAALGLPWL